ncbi:MAG TPA: maleylpyruvate isomerase family mycothiol-dependent enzyme [Acidimicrobiia bacterium]|nr:maleylpyruvate isomerase family mycothiol-dependent enzyme [Acidimicrobiia bacterium]
MRSDEYLDAIEIASNRMADALDADRNAPIPWCGDWTVEDCVQHVGGLQHVIVGVIDGRPAANFGLFKTLNPPKADDPALGSWFREGSAALLDRLRNTAFDELCWTFSSDTPTVEFWARRCAHETFVHGWDVARAAGIEPPTVSAEMVSDGLDEYLDMFTAMMRGAHQSPGAGETAHVHCTDAAGEWLITFPEAGARTLTREHAKGDVAFRGPAEGLLLYFWGRLFAEEAGIEIIGDPALASRWSELVPSV